VESLSGQQRVTFDVLRARLVEQVRLRINNGEFTERGLSRILGISQSQTHNVLKGARSLRTQLADRILAKLGLSAIDLLSEEELQTALQVKLDVWGRPFTTDEGLGSVEFALGNLMPPKKPATRSNSKAGPKESKTG
jgi:plasmid maintenance system antidote protein VapI